MVSWGDVAVGEIRPTQWYPSKSAILGLLASAMGVRRSEEQKCIDMEHAYALCSFVISSGDLLRDYHTVQAPTFNKKIDYHTRKEELAGKKLNTLLTSREYLTDANYLIAIHLKDQESAPFSLEQLKQGLLTPKYVLYLGRKSCPLALPTNPQIISSQFVNDAANQYTDKSILNFSKLKKTGNNPFPVYWEEGVPANFDETRMKSIKTRDKVRSRKRWQFDERLQHSTSWSFSNGE